MPPVTALSSMRLSPVAQDGITLRSECAKSRVLVQVIELETDQEEIAHRLKARAKGTEEISDARLEDLEKLSTGYEPPLELAPHLIKISTSGSIPDAVKAVLLQLAEKQLALDTL